jgi:iron complex outermembrane receptor protein
MAAIQGFCSSFYLSYSQRNRFFRAHATVFLSLALLAHSATVKAQTPFLEHSTPGKEAPLKEELELMKEEESVTIASRYEEPISQAPANVYVITDEDIRQSGAIDLPTLLRRVPGLDIMQMTGADFNVAVRGNNQTFARRMLVMVDGRSIYIDQLGFVFWKALPVTLPEIKRIEVLKGPASAVYGFNAVDGVINIITKSPEEIKGTTMQVGAGEYGTISSAAIHAGVHGKLGYRLSYGHDQTNQWSNRDALAYRSNLFNGQADYAFSSNSRIQFSGGIIDANRFDGPIDVLNKNQTSPVQTYARTVFQHHDFLVSAYWNGVHDNPQYVPSPPGTNLLQFTDPSGSPRTYVVGNTYNIDVQNAWRPTQGHRLVYGVNYRRIDLRSGVASQYTEEDRLGFFVQDEWIPISPLTVVAGVRYDLDTFINPTVSPRVALIYSPVEGHTIRLSYSVAYRPPTAFEERLTGQVVTTLPPPVPSPPPLQVGPSPNLEPEKFESYELAYQGWFWNHRLRVRSSAYFNHLTDVIFIQASGALASRANSPGVADFYGGDIGAEVLATTWLSGFVNYSYQQIGQSLTDLARRGTPHSKVNVGLRAMWDNGLSAEANYYYVGAADYPLGTAFNTLAQFFPPGVPVPQERVPSYNLLNGRIGFRFWQQRASAGYLREAEVAASIFNALNDKHKEHPIGETIGSRAMGWVTVRF